MRSKVQKSKNAAFIKRKAMELGFLGCGISKAAFLDKEAPRLEQWLKEGKQGQMKYMEGHFDKRLDPRKLVPGSKSVISLTYNYYTEKQQTDGKAPKLSKYAYGEDYHFVIKRKMRTLLEAIRSEIGQVEGRYFVDSAPVLDKAWAVKSGLGWIGKNSNLLSRETGSFFFISELIVDIDLPADKPFKTDHCGTCTKCIDACPTEAIVEPYVVDGSKCISYLTIELRDEIPEHFKGQMDDWMFGCDICQDVCPWNRFSKPHNEPAFEPSSDLLEMTRSAWQKLDKPTFNQLFKKSAVKRTGYKGLRRNISFLENKKAPFKNGADD